MLREIRRIREISQKDMAKKLGISQSYLSELEARKSIPSFLTLKKLSNVLEVCPIRIINFFEENEIEFKCCNECFHKK